MIITHEYISLFILAVFLALLAWIMDSGPVLRRTGEGSFKTLRNVTAFLLVLIIIWLCYLNFPVTLTALTFATGVIALIDLVFFRHKRKAEDRKHPMIVENAYAYFGVFLLVWVVRSFLIQPYHVPTGSLQPTVMPGDFIVVNQYAYGLHFPVGNAKFADIGEPKRGEIVLFYDPRNLAVVLVKRVVGLPGDHIEYRSKVLYVNGKEMKQTPIKQTMDDEPTVAGNPEEHVPVMELEENLDGVKHKIFVALEGGMIGDVDVVVPPGHYFMMGDNRDNSDDSRIWGFAPENYLIGRAIGIFMSWDALQHSIRWNRIGMGLSD